MKIDSSNVAVEANRKYTSYEENRFAGFSKVSEGENFKNSLNNFLNPERNNFFKNSFMELLGLGSDEGAAEDVTEVSSPVAVADVAETSSGFTYSSIKKQFNFFMAMNELIMRRLGGDDKQESTGGSEQVSSDDEQAENTQQPEASAEDTTASGATLTDLRTTFRPAMALNYESTYYEKESTSFKASGTVKTADGKEVSFNVDLKMERELKEKVELSIMMDPLVVNFNGSHAELMSEYFDFDLNADGELKKIPVLGQGSGMLVYDRDNSGIIEDGSEVIGGASGNGFDELRQYDEDHNGWIDENDPIYEKLSIWSKGENGEDVLVGLKEANVGAINLEDAETEFSLVKDKERLGIIRNTSVALTEDYRAITVQQIDFNVKETTAV